jgi:hypothetical protein
VIIQTSRLNGLLRTQRQIVPSHGSKKWLHSNIYRQAYQLIIIIVDVVVVVIIIIVVVVVVSDSTVLVRTMAVSNRRVFNLF